MVNEVVQFRASGDDLAQRGIEHYATRGKRVSRRVRARRQDTYSSSPYPGTRPSRTSPGYLQAISSDSS